MDLRITTLISAGDHAAALRCLAEAYGAAVGRYCAAMVGSAADAEELLQEALLEAFAAMPRYRGDAGARAWLFGIARRLCIRHLRRRDRRRLLLLRWWRGEEAEAAAADAGVDARLALERGLRELKPHLRDAVLLTYQAGLDGPELAAALGIRPDAARKRVSLGVQALRAALRPTLMDLEEDAHGPRPLPSPAGARGVGP